MRETPRTAPGLILMQAPGLDRQSRRIALRFSCDAAADCGCARSRVTASACADDGLLTEFSAHSADHNTLAVFSRQPFQQALCQPSAAGS